MEAGFGILDNRYSKRVPISLNMPEQILYDNLKQRESLNYQRDSTSISCICGLSTETKFIYSFSANLHPYNSKLGEYNREIFLNVGINYHKYQQASGGSMLLLNQFTDSFRSEVLGYRETQEVLSLHARFIRSTSAEKRFKFYTGAGIQIGQSVKSISEEYFQIDNTVDDSTPQMFSPNAPRIWQEELYTHAVKPISHFYLNIPFGVSLRYLTYLETAIEFNGFVGRQFVHGGNNYGRVGKSIGVHLRYNFDAFPIAR